MANFALLGVCGFVAPRHLEAIRATGNEVIVAVDPHDSAGILDRFFPRAEFLKTLHELSVRLEELRYSPNAIEYLTVCTPNDLHVDHVILGLENDMDVICEKPLIIDLADIDKIVKAETTSGRRVFTILQLRYHPGAIELRRHVRSTDPRHFFRVELSYVSRRGPWYQVSWKGQQDRSGGLIFNIGIHLLDLLLWLFGRIVNVHVHQRNLTTACGTMEFERACVDWHLSVNEEHLPEAVRIAGGDSYRSLSVDGREIDLTGGFSDLHTQCYAEIMAGHGIRINEVRPALELATEIRKMPISHPQLDHSGQLVRSNALR